MRDVALIPVHNEAVTIEAVLEPLQRARFRIICVCDGCTDGSDAIVEAWTRRNPGQTAVLWSRRIGVGGALRIGFEHVAGLLGEGVIAPEAAVCTIDADGQHSPDDLRMLVDLHRRSGCEVVQGVRLPHATSRLRRSGNRVLTRYARLLTGLAFEDVECGMRCISARIVPDVLRYFRGNGYGVGQELACCFHGVGARVDNHAPIRIRRARQRTRMPDFFVALRAGLATRWRVLHGIQLPRTLEKPPGYRVVGGDPDRPCGARP